MEETKQSDRKSMVMEGMYRGVTGKIDEVRQSVSKELQFTSAQQVSAYEALAGTFKDGLATLLAEFRYLSQQNSAIYDYNCKERETARDALLEAVRASAEQNAKTFSEQIEKSAKETEERFTEKLEALREELLENFRAVLAEKPEEEQPEGAAAAPAEEPAEDTFDYDVLAEKIASVLPEPDYDMLADKVVAALPPVDADAIADKVAAAVPPTDENAIADKVAESIPLVDYELIAERVSNVLEGEFDVTVDENGVEKIASAVAERLDYDKLASRVAELLKEQGALAVPVVVQQAPAPAPEPAPEPEPEPEPEPVKEELAVAAAPAKKLVVAPEPAPKPAPKPVALPVPEDPNMFTRLKRSFKAKIIESDEEVKGYYFDLKNAFLSYSRIASQVSWSNDRFTFAGDTIAKIGVRGKTLCLYLALNPDEFPSSVYHQRFAGDTKMYEKTPMMVKVKSGVALKRAIRLVEMLMENLGAVKEDRDPVDYSAEFAFRSEEQLLAEGLIKTAIVEKSDLDF